MAGKIEMNDRPICEECKHRYREKAPKLSKLGKTHYYRRCHMCRIGRVKSQNLTGLQDARWRATIYVLEYLKSHPCVDCDERDAIVLEFDHVRGTKVMEISRMVSRGCSNDKLQNEIDKCDVRCANCHVRRTNSTNGSRRYALLTGSATSRL